MKSKAKKVRNETLNRTIDAQFNQQMKQSRANMDVKEKMGQPIKNTGSPFGKNPKRSYQPKTSWA